MSVEPDGDVATKGVFSASGQMSEKTPDKLWWLVSLTHTAAWNDLVERWDETNETWVTDTNVDQMIALPVAPAGLRAPATTPLENPTFHLKIPADIGPDGTIQAGKIGPEKVTSMMSSHVDWTYYQEFSWTTMTPESGSEIDEDMPR